MKMYVGRNRKECQIDEDDYKRLKVKGNFFSVTSHGYVRFDNYIGVKNGKSLYKHTYLHREVMNCDVNFQVDHVNGDRLDNRKSNLRICTNGDNSRNKSRISGKYKGVYFNKINKKWIAQITFQYKNIYLGSFENIEDAAKCYNDKAVELHGEFAYLNK